MKSNMELGYSIFRDIYKGDKVYINNTVMEVKIQGLNHLKTSSFKGYSSVFCDMALIMDRDILEDDEGIKQLHQNRVHSVSLMSHKKKEVADVKMGRDYVFDINIDLDEVRTMNRGNLYLFYIVFIVKLQSSGDQTDYGWFAHPIFKDMIKFNTGSFEEKLWRPPPILDAPYNASDYT